MDKYYHKFYTEQIKNDWQQVIANSLDTWIFHDMDALQFLAQSRNSVNHSIVIYNVNSNAPVAVCPLFVHSKKPERFYLPGKKIGDALGGSGPAIIISLNEKKRRDVIRYLSEVLIELINREKINLCTVYASNLSQQCFSEDGGYTNPLHELRNGWINNPTAYYYLNLQKTEEQLRQVLETRTRTIINKLEKDNTVSIRKATGNDLDIIYNLFIETCERTGMPREPKSNLEWFLKHDSAEHYLASIAGEVACMVRVLRYKNTAVYSAGFTANKFIKVEIAAYTLWSSILQMKKQGIVHFELGSEFFEPIGNKPDGVSKFKRSFGGVLRYKFASVFERKTFLHKVLRKLLTLV